MWVQGGLASSVTALAYAPDGRTLYTGERRGYVRAWDVAARTARTLYRRSKGPNDNGGVYRMWPTPDGKRLLLGDVRGVLDALDPDAGPLLARQPGEECDVRYLLPDGRRVMSVEGPWRVGLWNLDTSRRLKVPGRLGKATDITYHQLLPDGVTLLTYDSASNDLPLWDFRTGKRVGELAPSASGINPCALSADGTTFAVGRDAALWVYDVPGRSLRHRLKCPKEVRDVAAHPNGRLVASATADSIVTLWDSVAGEEVGRYDWEIGKVESLAFAPDGLTCTAGGYRKFAVFDVDV